VFVLRSELWVGLAAAALLGCNSSKPSKTSEPAAADEHKVLDSVEALESGLDHTCALRKGKVYCWGQSLGGGGDSSLAREQVGLPPIVQMQSAGRRVCALSDEEALFCWGERLGVPRPKLRGQANRFQPANVVPPALAIRWGAMKKLDFGHPITRVAVGVAHTCALTGTGDLYCWGLDKDGQLSEPTPIERPHQMAENVDDVEVGYGWTCYVSGGKRRCRGSHPDMGELTQQQNLQFIPWQIASCGLSSAGEVHCVGRAALVYGGGPIPDEPGGETVKIQGLDQVKQLTLGAGHACVVRADGTVWCWGDNSNSQTLGRQNKAPAAIGLPGEATRVEAGKWHTCALLAESGEVVCWGRADDGQSGDSRRVSKIRVGEPMERRDPIGTITLTEVIERHEAKPGPAPE